MKSVIKYNTLNQFSGFRDYGAKVSRDKKTVVLLSIHTEACVLVFLCHIDKSTRCADEYGKSMMKIRLSYKLFAAFFMILAIVVGAMVLSRHLFSLNFKKYINQMEMERLESLVPIFQSYYQTAKSWDGIKSNPDHWQRLMRIQDDLKTSKPPSQENGPGMRPQPPSSKGRPPMGLPPFEMDFNKDPSRQNRPDGRLHNVFLMDAQHQMIIGNPGENELQPKVAIEVDGKVVGWLGNHPWKRPGPPDLLIKHQSRQIYLLSAGVIGLTALIAFVFSRHLLKPIKRLIQGTNELANRNFKVRIPATTRDELGKLADNFNAMAHTLENYEKTRQQWLTDISHELRTPLAILRGEIEALQDGVRKASPDNLASLHGEIIRISKLVEDLHLLSMADSASLQLNMQQIDICPILSALADNYRSRFESKQLHTQINLNDIKDIYIKGDKNRLEQVFTNIFENACKYVDSPGLFTVSGQIEDDFLTLYFQDSGPGVSKDHLPRLFDRLFRVDTSRNRDTGGSGLGLSICRHIIEVHGGTIWAEKSLMGGLSICVKIPMNGETGRGQAKQETKI